MTETLIGNYRVLEKIGEGGMGEVFRGQDVLLEREVAIKMLRADLSQRTDLVERFRTEAVALARLNHHNIATLYSFSQHGDQYYMVLEFVRGEPLDKAIARNGALPWNQAVNYAIEALAGLEHAHRLGIVHRDIKPANIMLCFGGGVKLMDFGIARLLERARTTQFGHMIGTLEYMSPEQIQGKDADARSDLYSMGAVLFEMLTGHLPFERGTDYELIRAHIEEVPQSVREFAGEVPKALEAMVRQAMAKDPAARFPSAKAFADVLSTLLRAEADDRTVLRPAGAASPRANAAPPVQAVRSGAGVTEVRRAEHRPAGVQSVAWRPPSLLALAGIAASGLVAVGVTVFALWPKSPVETASAPALSSPEKNGSPTYVVIPDSQLVDEPAVPAESAGPVPSSRSDAPIVSTPPLENKGSIVVLPDEPEDRGEPEAIVVPGASPTPAVRDRVEPPKVAGEARPRPKSEKAKPKSSAKPRASGDDKYWDDVSKQVDDFIGQ